MNAPYRLPANAEHGFGGLAIDRKTPLRFRLNGREISGFGGDTVLSAALASGLWLAGQFRGEPIGLSPHLPLLVHPVGTDAATALPAHRLPAVDGANLVTAAPRLDPMPASGLAARARLRLLGEERALNLQLDAGLLPFSPSAQTTREELSADLVVIGAGVAGLAAAGTAIGLGKRVILVERDQQTGGALSYFGAIDGEETPLAQITRLDKELAGKGELVLLTGAEALRVASGEVLVHQIRSEGGQITSRMLALAAPRVVLATGAGERLPIYPGNRLPFSLGSVAAFQLAERFGVVPGRRLVVSTSHAHAYRYALYGRDAGLDILRIADLRLEPRSRYVDFCMASGLTLSTGLVPERAQLQKKTGTLRFTLANVLDAGRSAPTEFDTDAIIAAGGFQPRLDLWVAAGGAIIWDKATHQFRPRGTIEGLVVAGSAAGWQSTRAAIGSGKAAALTLFGKAASPVDDPALPSHFESTDAPTAISRASGEGKGQAFLDAGAAFTLRRPLPVPDLATEALTHPTPLGLDAIAALLDLGQIDPGHGTELARERIGIALTLTPAEPKAVKLPKAAEPAFAPENPLPAYLAGRFGPRPLICRLGSPEARRFEVGQLIHREAVLGEPETAIGVVIAGASATEQGGWALIGAPPEGSEVLVFVRDGATPQAARVLARHPARFS